MTTEVINIQIREDGSRVVARNLRDVGAAAEDATSPVEQLKGLLASLVTAAAVAQVARLADEYTNLQNRLRLVTTGTENLSRVTRELQGIANDTRSDFGATAELYSRLASTTKDLGLSQAQLLGFTKSLNQAIVLSGASASEAAGGLRQLAQGLASGTLRGDELNSVMENFPKVAQIIAEGMGKSIGEVRKLGAEGAITAQIIIDAFAKASGQLEADFGTTVPTLSQSFTVLRNNFMIFLGELNESTGATAALSSLIIKIANNLNIILPILGAVGVAVGIAFSIGPIVAMAGALQKLFWLAAANPFTALAAVIGTVLTALFFLRDEIKLGIDDTTTLGDLMRSVWEPIGELVSAAGSLIGDFFDWVSGKSADAYNAMTDHTASYQQSNEALWLRALRTVVQVFDMIGGVIRGTMAGVGAVVGQFVDAWINNFKQLGNVVTAIANGDIEAIKAAVASNKDGYKQAATTAGSVFSAAFQQEILSQADSGLEALLNDRIARAQEIGRERMKGTKGGLTGGNPPRPPSSTSDSVDAARELERLANALRNVMDQADPVAAAQRSLAEAQGILNEAVGKGLITQTQATEAYERLAERMSEQLDPLGALNEAIDVNTNFLRMGNDQREIEMELYRSMENLRRSGVTLTQEETDALRAKLVVERELTRIAQVRDSLESGSQGSRQRDLQDLMTAITAARSDPSSGVSEGDAFNALNNSLGGLLDNSRAAVQAQLEQQAFYYEQVQALRDNDLINEETYQAARMQIWANTQSLQLQTASDFFGQLSQLSKSENKKIAAIGKAAAISQTIINTYQSATAAYASMAGIPYVGPFLGAAAAAAAVVAGMANVSAIRSQTTGFRTGGNLMVGGSGGTDSQLVAFRATPGERVQVNTPSQARALERAAEPQERGPRNVVMNLTVVQQGKPDRTTPYQTARQSRREVAKEFSRS